MSTDSQLQVARAAVTTARTRHEEDLAALQRGRERLAVAEAELKRCAADDEEAIARHAARLEKQTREGATGAPPALVPTDEQMAARVTAQRTHEAARRMVISLESAARGSAAEVASVEEALQAAVLAAISEEADARAAHLEALRAQVEEDERILSAVRDVPNFRPSLAVFRALRDTLNVPVHELTPTGSWDRSWNTPVNKHDAVPIDAQQFWTDRLAALTSGTDAGQQSAAA